MNGFDVYAMISVIEQDINYIRTGEKPVVTVIGIDSKKAFMQLYSAVLIGSIKESHVRAAAQKATRDYELFINNRCL